YQDAFFIAGYKLLHDINNGRYDGLMEMIPVQANAMFGRSERAHDGTRNQIVALLRDGVIKRILVSDPHAFLLLRASRPRSDGLEVGDDEIVLIELKRADVVNQAQRLAIENGCQRIDLSLVDGKGKAMQSAPIIEALHSVVLIRRAPGKEIVNLGTDGLQLFRKRPCS